MTGITPAAGYPLDLSDVPAQRLVQALPEAHWKAKYPHAVQERNGEESAAVSAMEELRAIYTSPWFWTSPPNCPPTRSPMGPSDVRVTTRTGRCSCSTSPPASAASDRAGERSPCYATSACGRTSLATSTPTCPRAGPG